MRDFMRILLMAGLIAMMAFAFAACGDSDTDEKSASDDTETKTTEATEATDDTEAADVSGDYDIMEGFKLEENGSMLLLYGNGFVLTMPNNDNWGYEQISPTTLSIYEKDAREDGFEGDLVNIMAFDPSDKSYEVYPDYTVAGTSKNLNKKFIAQFPSDVRFDPNNPDQEADYSELFDHVNKIAEGMADSPFQVTDGD